MTSPKNCFKRSVVNLDDVWYRRNPMAYALWPLSLAFGTAVRIRQSLYNCGLKKVSRLPVPVIVVGNLSVGGTGKTPMVIALVRWLIRAGYSPGVVSRGYGRKNPAKLHSVRDSDAVFDAGDEALLIARNTGVPVVVGADRVAAANKLLEETHCNVVVSDDGLQHYAMGRDLEVLMIDGQRRFGNQQLLPAGPLREPVTRAQHCDFRVVTEGELREGEYGFALKPVELVKLTDSKTKQLLSALSGATVHAVAGIGNPDRFFDALRQNQIDCIEHRFDDHHVFLSEDFDFEPELPIVMTEKDAVKCTHIDLHNAWYLAVEPVLSKAFERDFAQQIQTLTSQHG